jgi:hypothetical protein
MIITDRGAGQRKNGQCPATFKRLLALIRMLRLNDVMFAK